MEDFEEFEKNFANFFGDYLKKDLELNKAKYGRAAYNLIFDEKGPRTVHTIFTPYEAFVTTIWKGFIEIMDSFDYLNDIAYYINSFPYKSKKLSKARTLKYHYENYLNELYILKKRLLNNLTVIGRLYRKDKNHPAILLLTKPLFPLIRNNFDTIIKIRGSHIHVRRYNHPDFTRLGSLELFAKNLLKDEEIDLLYQYYVFKYKETRKKWKESIIKNNNVIRKILNQYFKVVNEIFFDENGKMVFPSTLKVKNYS